MPDLSKSHVFASPRALRRGLALAALALLGLLPAPPLAAQAEPDWAAVERETLEHFQALLRIDTSNPPGNETRAVEYLKGVLEREGIPVQVFALDPQRANLVARLEGSGEKRPLLLMGHTDVVTAIPERWTHPPFAAVRDGGHVYGRGALDDKDNVAASLMMMLMLKRLDVPLDRDVIFLAEAGEESTTRWGIDFMTEQHWPAIEAEFCLAEGGTVVRRGGEVQFASIGTLEKLPRMVELIAQGTSGHGSVPRMDNAVARLSRAVAALAAWEAPVRLNQTTREYFRRMAAMAPPEQAERFRAVLSGDPARVRAALEYFREHTPQYAALMRTSVSPTMLSAGDRANVIPSEARATLDVRMLPDDDPEEMLALMRRVIDDPSVEVRFLPRDGQHRPSGGTSIDTQAFSVLEEAVEKHYDTVTLPTMSTGATDMAQVRAKGTHCYGIGPAVDAEDGPAGFGAHGDQERILESELHRFVRFYWDVVTELAEGR